MADKATWTLASLAEALGLRHAGDGSIRLTGVATLEAAGPDELAFIVREAYLERLPDSSAGAVIVPDAWCEDVDRPALLAANAHAAFARAAQLLHPEPMACGVRATSASISPDAVVADDVDVASHAVIEDGVVIGSGCRIGHGCVIEEGAILGANCYLAPRVVVARGTVLGDRVRIQSGAVIGGEGFGFARDEAQWVRVPQRGRVVIGNDVDIGANTTIDRGTLDDTVIGNGVIVDNLVQLAHNVVIGDHTAIAGCAGVAGSTRIGRRCRIGGGAGIIGHLRICDDVTVSAMTLVSRSIDQPGMYTSGAPMESHAKWRRNAVRLRHLDEMEQRLSALEQQPVGDRGKEDS